MKLVQALVVKGGRVLLGRWKTGVFAGQISGCLGQVRAGASPEEAAVEIARSLTGLELDPRRFDRRALFTFHELDDQGAAECTYHEHELLYDGDAHEPLVPVNTADFEPEWFEFDEIPFDQMPEDDLHWYGRVLAGELMQGEPLPPLLYLSPSITP